MVHAKIRARWYQFMTAVEDVTTQRHGLVSVAFGVHKFDTSFAMGVHTLTGNLPIRIARRHIFIPSMSFHPVVRALLNLWGEELRLQSRVHCEGVYLLVGVFQSHLHGQESWTLNTGSIRHPSDLPLNQCYIALFYRF